MTLTEEQIQKFIEIYEKKTGVLLINEDAEDTALSLINFLSIPLKEELNIN